MSIILERVVKEGLSDRETFEQKPEVGREEPFALLEQVHSRQRKQQMLAPKSRKGMTCSKNSAKARLGRAW